MRAIVHVLFGGFRSDSGAFGTRKAARVPNLEVLHAWANPSTDPPPADIRACFPDTNAALAQRLAADRAGAAVRATTRRMTETLAEDLGSCRSAQSSQPQSSRAARR